MAHLLLSWTPVEFSAVRNDSRVVITPRLVGVRHLPNSPAIRLSVNRGSGWKDPGTEGKMLRPGYPHGWQSHKSVGHRPAVTV